jgi:3',5'-cyclic AMP phosphodiesterase CpdA
MIALNQTNPKFEIVRLSDLHPKFAIVHLSDLHFGRFFENTKSKWLRKLSGTSEHNYNLSVSICTKINELHMSLQGNLDVVVTGDLTTSAHPAAFGVVATYVNGAHYISPYDKIGLNLGAGAKVIPGNHDMFIKSIFGMRSRSDVYEKYFPKGFPDFKIQKTSLGYIVFFYLDSNRVGGFNPYNLFNTLGKGEIGATQRGDLLALETVLRKKEGPREIPNDFDYDASLKVILMHHHIRLPDDPPRKTTILELKDACEVLEVFEQLRIHMILCGHQHHPYHGVVGRTREIMFSCSGTATKMDEDVNSFKVYYFEDFRNAYMQEYQSKSEAWIYRFGEKASETVRIPLWV